MEIFRIDGEIHSSKNARQIFRANNGRTYVVKSDASKNDEQMMDVQLLQQKTLWDDIVTSLTFPLYVNFVFFRKSRRRWDFANLVQGVADAMVKAGYLPDDDVCRAWRMRWSKPDTCPMMTLTTLYQCTQGMKSIRITQAWSSGSKRRKDNND